MSPLDPVHEEELRRESERLRDLQEKKRVLAALVVHDLRNPLAALQGNLSLLEEELATGSGASELSREILGDCTELVGKTLELVNGILDVEELEEGLLAARPSEIRLLDLVNKSAKSHAVPLRQRELRLELALADSLVVRLDPELFHRLLENLLDNAVRYAVRGGVVRVQAELTDGWLTVGVGNDGPAIPAVERDKIFGRYYRLDARRAGARANRGLGLYFCRLAAEAHGGLIAVEESPPGTLFVVRIPQD